MLVEYGPRAIRQIQDLFDYIERHSGQQRASGYILRIERFCLGLAQAPLQGRVYEGSPDGLRVISFERRVTVIYAVLDHRLVITGVFYGGQNWAAAIREPLP